MGHLDDFRRNEWEKIKRTQALHELRTNEQFGKVAPQFYLQARDIIVSLKSALAKLETGTPVDRMNLEAKKGIYEKQYQVLYWEWQMLHNLEKHYHPHPDILGYTQEKYVSLPATLNKMAREYFSLFPPPHLDFDSIRQDCNNRCSEIWTGLLPSTAPPSSKTVSGKVALKISNHVALMISNQYWEEKSKFKKSLPTLADALKDSILPIDAWLTVATEKYAKRKVEEYSFEYLEYEVYRIFSESGINPKIFNMESLNLDVLKARLRAVESLEGHKDLLPAFSECRARVANTIGHIILVNS